MIEIFGEGAITAMKTGLAVVGGLALLYLSAMIILRLVLRFSGLNDYMEKETARMQGMSKDDYTRNYEDWKSGGRDSMGKQARESYKNWR